MQKQSSNPKKSCITETGHPTGYRKRSDNNQILHACISLWFIRTRTSCSRLASNGATIIHKIFSIY